MADFTLDTSGSVRLPRSPQSVIRNHLWSDLDAFTQGYVEALLTHLWEVERLYHLSQDLSFGWLPAFSDLSPEALAMILADCARFLTGCAGSRTFAFASDGRLFWEGRQAGNMPANFPPLTVALGDDGRVRLREVA